MDVKKSQKIKFEDFAKSFLDLHSRVNKRPRVAKRDEGLIKHLSRQFGGKYLYEITPYMIEEYKKKRSSDKIGDKNIAPATINREVACLKCMFNKAIEWGKANDNPARKVKLFRENNVRLRYLEKEEIIKLIEACSGNLKAIVTVALFTGMRKAEILNLQWRNINIEHGIIYLLETKNGERREVLMHDIVKKAIVGVPKHPNSQYVFCKKNGNPYKSIRNIFDAALKKCGIINFRFHDLRHTFASQLVMSGVDLKTVQELLGHKSIEMTLRYSHLSPDHKKRAIDVLGFGMDTIWTPRPVLGKVDKIGNLHNILINNGL